ERILGVERPHSDVFHPEPGSAAPQADPSAESLVLTRFLQALLDRHAVLLRYQAPYRGTASSTVARPLGLFLDRGWWYLVGELPDERPAAANSRRLWRADRVVELAALPPTGAPAAEFDVGALLDHAWLKEAMQIWRQRAP